jgi:hypothetical protein
MGKALKVYSAAEVSVIFALIPLDSGRGEDEFAAISKSEDTYTYKAGVDGEGTRSENQNTYHEVKLTMMASSDANAILSAIHSGDLAVPGGAGIAPLLIRDKQGTSVFAAQEAWIVKWPDKGYGKEVGTVEWTLGVHSPSVFIGGN